MTSALSGPPELTTTDLARLAVESRALIASYQDASGAYPASPDFSAYRGYSWFRDGAFIADAMSAAGDTVSAEAFHGWCAGILIARRTRVEEIVAAARAGTPVPDAQMLATRFRFDGAEGGDDWWDFQLDGYGTWVWAVVEHGRRSGRLLTPWTDAIRLAVAYLASSWDRPCYDWWEEHSAETHVSTLGCVVAGLEAGIRSGLLGAELEEEAASAAASARALIAERGIRDGHLVKWLGSREVDASLASLIAPLAVFPADDALAAPTVDAVADALDVDGGVHRYLADTFYGGGQWPLLSCILGLASLAVGDRAAAEQHLRWAAATSTAAGEIPEQVDQHLLAPGRREEWLDRWGTVACPLLWSSAMYLRLALELGVVTPAELAS